MSNDRLRKEANSLRRMPRNAGLRILVLPDGSTREGRRFTVSSMSAHWLRLFMAATAVAAAALSCGRAEDADDGWPQGASIAENSRSPDGRFGILLPPREESMEKEEDEIRNTLVQVESLKELAVVENSHYFPGENHSWLDVAWAPDSTWCVVTYDGRFGFEAITLLKKRGSGWDQADIGSHIQKALNAAVARQAENPETICSATAYFRPGAGGKLLVRATGLTNPRYLPDLVQHFAVFLGAYDTTSGRWIRSETRDVDNFDAFDFAFSDDLGEKTSFTDEDERLAWFDDRLNDVWSALKVVLPPASFAALKKEQKAWLEKLETADSPATKTELIAERIKELRAFVW